jgi:copper(I)-binding protein
MTKALFLLPAACLALAACGDAGKPDAPAQPASESAAPEAKPGLSATGGVLVLPAVKGRPGVAYFALANGSAASASLAAVHVEGAGKAEMHQTVGGRMSPVTAVDLAPGATVKFERGGMHVMLFDLAESLAAGGTAEMTLTFAGGDKLSAPLAIEAAGGAGTDHGAAH